MRPAAVSLHVAGTGRVAVEAPGDVGFGIVHDGCAGIAVPVPSAGRITFNGLAAGNCSLTLAGAGGVTVHIAVRVEPATDAGAAAAAKMPVRVAPPSAILARGTWVKVRIVQGDYKGPFSIAGDCAGIATLSGIGAGVVVLGLEAGTCAATFTGLGGHSAKLALEVVPSPRTKP